MKAVVYTRKGGTEVLRIVEREVPEPGPGEVRVRMAVSGVNPTDCKTRSGVVGGTSMPFAEVVPNQDGSGVIDKVGTGVAQGRVGQRVWVWEAAWQRADGTAQELVILPDDHAVELPHDVGFDVGASIGIPALTAHRCLTVGIGQTGRLGLGSLIGRTVLVVGGAGAVGHAAIELATWAGARVVTTVRSEQKAALAALAGADRVVNSVHEDVAAVLRAEAPNGFDLIVEVDPSGNAQIDWGVVGQNGTIVVYADSGGEFTVPVRQAMTLNLRLQFVLIYTVPIEAKNQAVLDVSRAIDDGALRIGADAGLPVRWFSLDRTAEAHAAVDRGAVGKVLIDVDGVSGSA